MFGFGRVNVLLCGEILVYRTVIKKNKEVPRVLKTELEVETIGEPSVQALPEAEQRSFFETLLARIKELKENQDD